MGGGGSFRSSRNSEDSAVCKHSIAFSRRYSSSSIPSEVLMLVIFLQVRVFTYAIGPTANPIAAVKWMACANRGEHLAPF